MKSETSNNLAYLEFLRDIYEVSVACSTKTYIWGGFTHDIFEGEFIRDHGDLDGFTENMMSVLDDLISNYKNRGYTTEFKNNINMLVIRRDGLHAAFNSLDVDESVAMWRHIGNHGTVYFPYKWLDDTPRDFYDVKVYTSGIYFEYGFRKIAKSINPDWKAEREKDKITIDYLQRKLDEIGIDPKTILRSIWSYNPIWIKKGYDPFDIPVLVCPLVSDHDN